MRLFAGEPTRQCREHPSPDTWAVDRNDRFLLLVRQEDRTSDNSKMLLFTPLTKMSSICSPPIGSATWKRHKKTESSFVLWGNLSKMLATARWLTDDPHQRLSVLEGVPLEQYGLVALAKPSVKTKKQAVWYSFTFLLPLHSIPLFPAFASISIPPLFHMLDPAFWTALTAFHAVIESTTRARQRCVSTGS